jgi:butyryl-CoA dehydrogenase
MFDFLFSDDQLKLRDEVRDFVKSIPRQMILDMDADKIEFPKEFLQEAGKWTGSPPAW